MSRQIEIKLPGSKSLTQRYLILSALAKTQSILTNVSPCSDSTTMMEILKSLGVKYFQDGCKTVVSPNSFLQNIPSTIYCKDGGTTLRFLAPLPLFMGKPIEFTGSKQLASRPMKEITAALKQLGATINFKGKDGYLPFIITPPSKLINSITINSQISSQPLSSLLLWGSKLNEGLVIKTDKDLVSSSYVEMTKKTLSDFDIPYFIEDGFIKLNPSSWNGKTIDIERDQTLHPYLHTASFITGLDFTTDEKTPGFRQEDIRFKPLLKTIFSGNRIDINLKDTPDLLPPLVAAVIAAKKGGSFSGLSHTRYKESNRLRVLSEEISKLGVKITETNDGLEISGSITRSARLNAHNDHRMAMTFGLLALINKNIKITGGDSVSKSWPTFWNEFEKFGLSSNTLI
jgi:3-phosphoshikimate 1-carboxyvinyltransferase